MRNLRMFVVIAALTLVGFTHSVGAVFQPPAKVEKKQVPLYRGLDSALYVQTSAEYRAACKQAYRYATLLLNTGVRDNCGKKLGVVLDLDETVLDNSAFYTYLMKNELAYEQGLWESWEYDDQELTRFVPGAEDFLKRAREQNVQIVFISNRTEELRERTKLVLKRLKISVPDQQLILLPRGQSGNKTARRAKAEELFKILLYVGDNLRDFHEDFKFNPQTQFEGRKAMVDMYEKDFGEKFIILPNPLYGEFMKGSGLGDKTEDKEKLFGNWVFKPLPKNFSKDPR